MGTAAFYFVTFRTLSRTKYKLRKIGRDPSHTFPRASAAVNERGNLVPLHLCGSFLQKQPSLLGRENHVAFYSFLIAGVTRHARFTL